MRVQYLHIVKFSGQGMFASASAPGFAPMKVKLLYLPSLSTGAFAASHFISQYIDDMWRTCTGVEVDL